MVRYRILIVDDQHEVRRMLAAALKTLGAGFDVLEVPSAEEAMLISATLPLDLVVSDVRLPGMSGLELVAKLKKRHPQMKLILVTGMLDPIIRRMVTEAGAEAFFYKPVEIADFLDAVERCLGLVKPGFPPPPAGQAPLAAGSSANQAKTQPVEAQPAAEPASPPRLASRLSALRDQLRATAVILLDEAGQVMADAGDLAEIHQGSSLLTSLMASFSASLKLSYSLGQDAPETLSFFKGKRFSLCVAPVGATCALLVATAEGFKPEQLGEAMRLITQAARDLRQILDDLGVEMKPARAEPQPEAGELPEDTPLDPQLLASMETWFAQAIEKKSSSEDANAYWDDLQQQKELDGSSNADALSYDQARKLGLAPSDEDTR